MRTEDTLPPALPAAIEDLLASERALVALPEMVRARALARAREALRDSPEGARPRRRVAPARNRRLVLAAAAGVAILAGTAAAFQMIRRPAPHSEASQVPRLPAAAPNFTGPALALAPVAAPVRALDNVAPASPKADSPTRKPAFAGKREGGLEEVRLLDQARQSDARGDYATALTVVAEHERGFPAGRLSEEREVLRLKALVGLGRGNEARHAAARFHRQFPRSVLLRKIDDMLASLP
jgi:hypothetical protein